MSAAQAHVVRAGTRRSLDAAHVVAGDVIVVEEGDVVPADARVLHSTALQTAEASLTGESLPVLKDPTPVAGDAALGDRHSMIYSGTTVTFGRGRAVVVATGMRTELGRVAGMLRDAPPEELRLDQGRVQTRLHQMIIIGAIRMINLPVDRTFVKKHKSVRVAKRAFISLDHNAYSRSVLKIFAQRLRSRPQ